MFFRHFVILPLVILPFVIRHYVFRLFVNRRFVFRRFVAQSTKLVLYCPEIFSSQSHTTYAHTLRKTAYNPGRAPLARSMDAPVGAPEFKMREGCQWLLRKAILSENHFFGHGSDSFRDYLLGEK